MGKHAAPGRGRFTRELSSFALRLLVVAGVFFGIIWAMVNYGPDLFSRDGDDSVPPVESTSTTEAPASTVPETTVSSTIPVVPLTTTSITLPETTTTTAPPERAPADIRVLVLNSTTRSGLAATVRAALDALGYDTLVPDNSTPTLAGSQILFAPTFAAEAYTLAAQFPDGEALPNPSDDPPADIVVILGTDYVP
jgi:hypothetical protein